MSMAVIHEGEVMPSMSASTYLSNLGHKLVLVESNIGTTCPTVKILGYILVLADDRISNDLPARHLAESLSQVKV